MGKLPYDYDDQRATERNIARASYEEILRTNWARDNIDLRYTVPRAWPPFSYLTEEEMQQLADIHPSAPPLKGISDYDVKLVQRLLYYTRQDLWLSDSDKEWHYPLLLTLRENIVRTGGTGVLRPGRRDGKKRSATGIKAKENWTNQIIAFCVGFWS